MKSKGPTKRQAEIRQKTLPAAARMFLEHGYTGTSVRELARQADVQVSAMIRVMGNKENILLELVKHVMDGQYTAARKLLVDKTQDPVLYYAVETTLQLYIAESDEAIRNLYYAAYTMPETSSLIRQSVAEILIEPLFRSFLPELEAKDFYELEIASGSIIRGYMTIPCDPYFTMERKVRRFLETSLRLYRVPEETIQEAIDFVRQFDYPTLARETVDNMLNQLDGNV